MSESVCVSIRKPVGRCIRSRPDRGVRMRAWIRLGMIGALVLTFVLPVRTEAQDDSGLHLLALINQARLREGLAPLGNSTLLNRAAQRHADDLASEDRQATLGQVTHEGSDGSGYQQRIREARYSAWNDGLMVDEVLWAGLGTAEDALVWFRRQSGADAASGSDWEVLTDVRYREAGVGYAEDDGVRHFVVVVGARPGVLPIFINDGVGMTESPLIALRLTNEEAVPLGDGASIGKAIEVRLSNRPDFEGLPWQPWEPLLPWQLSGEELGEYAVYVEFRDGAGRTAVAEAIIRLVAPGESPPILRQQPADTMFLDGDEPVSELPTAGSPDAEELPTPTPPIAAQPGGAEPLPTSLPDSPTGTLAVYPTWTPLPTDLPDVVASNGPDWPLLAVFLLQGMALLLGAAAFLRRR